MRDPQLLLVAGLPGCGKSGHLDGLEHQAWLKFDDYKNHARNNSRCFRDSLHYSALVGALREGRRCVVADIDFCRTESRYEAEFVLHEDLPDVRFAWVFFANDPGACERNIRRRSRESLENDLRELRRYSSLYSIPAGAQVLPVPHAER